MEAKIGRDPCLSSPVLGPFAPPLDAILTVTVADGVDVPSIVNEAGVIVQVAPVGTVHWRLTG
jgi:hypothetical protein